MKYKSEVLTREERDIIVLAGQSLTNNEIAERLGISTSKVKSLIHRACIKLKVHNRNEAVKYVIMRGDPGIQEFYPINEIADFLSGLGVNHLKELAQLLRQRRDYESSQWETDMKLCFLSQKCLMLTKREQDVISLIGRGLTNQEIADTLIISISAVRAFIHNAFKKLRVRNRAEALIVALKQRAVNIEQVYSVDELMGMVISMGPESVEAIIQLLSQKAEQKCAKSGSQIGPNPN